LKLNLLILLAFFYGVSWVKAQTIVKVHEIRGSIAPKSIVSSSTGLFAAQNMMYKHTVTIYNSSGELLATIKDNVNLKVYGYSDYNDDTYLGGPVEACFSNKGKFLWVSNYSMIGTEFINEGCDACMGSIYDPSFVYKINTTTFKIENVIKVGSVPKYLAINELIDIMVVSNWTSSDVSIIDLRTEKEIKRIKVGKHPRGIVITKNGQFAYVTIMGSTKIAVINLETNQVNYIYNVGKSPRHLVLDEKEDFLYCSTNSDNQLVKINLKTKNIIKCKTKAGPRTMILSANDKYIYVVNYFSDSFQKIDVETMQVIETIKTGHHPIGITINKQTSEIWVSCYEGKIQIFKDIELEQQLQNSELLADVKQTKIKHIPTYDAQKYLTHKKQKNTVQKKQSAHKKSSTNQSDSKIENISTSKNTIAKNTNNNTNSNCKYHLIIGSFGVKSNAERLKQKMIEKGYPAQLLPSSNQKLTMVSIQCFDTQNEALSSKSKILQDTQQKGWVYAVDK